MSEHALSRFSEALACEGVALDRVALLLGDWDHPELDVDGYCAQLDAIARRVRATLPEQDDSVLGKARAINAVLFDELGFRGNVEDYYDPKNSFLGQVLERRTGIPITLCVLFLEIARRVGVLAQGVSFPGHFLVRVADEDSWRFFDIFDRGRLLSTDDLLAILRRGGGPEVSLHHTFLAAASKRKIVARMLMNLAGIYAKHGDMLRSLYVLERLAIVEPENERLARELASLRAHVENLN